MTSRNTVRRATGAALALAVLVGILQLSVAPAATPASVTLDRSHTRASWTGGPLNGSAPARRGITCDPDDSPAPNCDQVLLNIDFHPADFAGKVVTLHLKVEPDGDNAMEIVTCKPSVCESLTSTGYDNATTSTQVNGITVSPKSGPVSTSYDSPEWGTWKIRADCVKCANAKYAGSAWLTFRPIPKLKKGFVSNFATQLLPLDSAKAGAGEPGVRFGPHGEVWVDGPGGSGDFWGSYDGGKTFALSEPGLNDAPNSTGPGDTWSTVGADGTIFADILYLSLGGGNVVYRSKDKGKTWTALPGASQFSNDPAKPAALANVNSDRQWITADPQIAGTVYFTYHDLGDGSIWVYKTTDNGDTWTPTASITGQELVNKHEIDSFAGNTTGPIVIAPDGSLYFLIMFSNFVEGQTAPPTRQDFDIQKIYICRSTDGGINWSFSMAHDGTGKEYVHHGHPSLAIDKASNVFLVYSSRPGPDGAPDPARTGSPAPADTRTTIFMVSSRDKGATWSQPVRISTNKASNVFATAVANGKPGYVDIAWLASPSLDFNDHTAQWTVQMAQTMNGLSAKPKLTYQQVSPDVVHKADICQAGTLCLVTGGNRNLLDYIWMTTDSRGAAVIVYPDDASGTLRTVIARQQAGATTRGTSLKAPKHK